LKENIDVDAITGRFLAHNRHDRVGRAFMAADLFTGATRLVKPTVTQAAFLADVNCAYAHWAIKRQAERAAIEAGLIPLVSAAASKANGTRVPLVPALPARLTTLNSATSRILLVPTECTRPRSRSTLATRTSNARQCRHQTKRKNRD
jgi:hypothetical protein